MHGPVSDSGAVDLCIHGECKFASVSFPYRHARAIGCARLRAAA
jgi:hypothetical protein